MIHFLLIHMLRHWLPGQRERIFFGRSIDLVSGWQRICACAVPHPLCT